MNLFIDKNHRRKSPIAIAGFFATLLDLCIYGVLYTLLAEPLYRQLTLPSTAATNAVHTLIIALAGTAIGSLLFLLRDKRVALFGFVGLAVVLVMFYFAAWMLDTDQRATMVQLITLYGVAPALIGNAVAWPVYLKLRKTHPLPVRRLCRRRCGRRPGPRLMPPPKRILLPRLLKSGPGGLPRRMPCCCLRTERMPAATAGGIHTERMRIPDADNRFI